MGGGWVHRWDKPTGSVACGRPSFGLMGGGWVHRWDKPTGSVACGRPSFGLMGGDGPGHAAFGDGLAGICLGVQGVRGRSVNNPSSVY